MISIRRLSALFPIDWPAGLCEDIEPGWVHCWTSCGWDAGWCSGPFAGRLPPGRGHTPLLLLQCRPSKRDFAVRVQECWPKERRLFICCSRKLREI